MSPENGTHSPRLGPLPRRGARLAGGAIATLALVLAGFATPAMASSHTVKTRTPNDCKNQSRTSESDPCHNGGGGGGDEGRQGPPGPPGSPGPCEDWENVDGAVTVGTAVAGFSTTTNEFDAVLQNGRLSVSQGLPGSQVVPFDVASIANTPANTCGVSLSYVPPTAAQVAAGTPGTLYVDVVTTTGNAYEATCTPGVPSAPNVDAALTCNAAGFGTLGHV